MRVVDRALWLGFWWVKYLPLPGQGGNTEVEVLKRMEGGSVGIVGAVVTTTLASVVAEATKAALAEAIAASARGLAEAVVGNVTDKLGGDVTATNAIATEQVGKEPESVAAAHRVEL